MPQSKESMQTKLTLIKDLCSDLSATAERCHDTPDDLDLIVLVGDMEEACRGYLQALSA